MKTELVFYDYDTKVVSDCGETLEIEVSSNGLGWKGIILEKGSAPYFNTTNIATPYFYFALSVEHQFSWNAYPNSKQISLKTSEGEIWINPPNTPFSHEISEQCYFIILALEKDYVMDIIMKLDFHGSSSLEFINNYNVDDEVMSKIIELIYQETLNLGSNGYTFVETLVRALIIHYVKNYSNIDDFKNEVKNISSTINDKAIKDINSYISDHLKCSINIDELAKLVNISKFHFLKEFKKAMGITPYQHILQSRLKKAKEYLDNTNGAIADIADMVGFADQSHFSRTFKMHNGITPQDYRNRKSNF